MKVDLINVDYRVALRINDQEVLATSDAEYHPDVEELRKLHKLRTQGDYQSTKSIFPQPTVSIHADHQSSRITHLSLWRDVYYTPGSSYNNSNQDYAGMPESDGIYLHRKGERSPGEQLARSLYRRR